MAVNLTPKARAVFERRLSVIQAYDAARRQAKKAHRAAGTRFRASDFTEDFALANDVAYGTIHRWWSAYIKEGEEALIPGWGKNKGKTIIKARLAHLMDHLIVPSRSTGEIIEDFLAACAVAGEKPPCKATIQSYIKARRNAADEPYARPRPAPAWEKLEERIASIEGAIIRLREELRAAKSGDRKTAK